MRDKFTASNKTEAEKMLQWWDEVITNHEIQELQIKLEFPKDLVDPKGYIGTKWIKQDKNEWKSLIFEKNEQKNWRTKILSHDEFIQRTKNTIKLAEQKNTITIWVSDISPLTILE